MSGRDVAIAGEHTPWTRDRSALILRARLAIVAGLALAVALTPDLGSGRFWVVALFAAVMTVAGLLLAKVRMFDGGLHPAAAYTYAALPAVFIFSTPYLCAAVLLVQVAETAITTTALGRRAGAITACFAGAVSGTALLATDRDRLFLELLAFAVAAGAVVTVVGRLADELRAEHARHRALIGGLDAIVWEAVPDGTLFTYVSPQAERILGYPVSDWYRSGFWFEHVHPDDVEPAAAVCTAAVAAGLDHEFEYRMYAADGRLVHLHDIVSVEMDSTGRPRSTRGVLIDITERRSVETGVRRLADIVEHIHLGLVVARETADGDVTIIAANPEACHITDRAVDALVGMPVSVLPFDLAPDLAERLQRVITDRGGFDGEVTGSVGNGARLLSLHAFPLPDRSVGLSIRDVTDVQRSAEALRWQATHDALTGLPNRMLLADRLHQAVAVARRAESRVALLMMDLDQFKVVNDTLGHDHGDRLLAAVADRLRDLIRESDTVARLGGDEFAVLLTTDVSSRGATEVAERVAIALGAPFDIDGLELHTRPSTGIAIFPDHGVDPEALLQRADVAMYAAKRTGRDFALYQADEDRMSRERLTLVSDLRRAVDSEQFELHYQPVIDIREQRVVGVEALLRWPQPDGTVICPDQFLDAARVSGLVVPITTLVLDRALAEVANLVRPDGQPLMLAVNLSARNLSDPTFADVVEHRLESMGFPPELLTLEVTETEVMDDPNQALIVLSRLRAIGVRISLDDFGTGHSSLLHLKQLPIHELKIDRSFVHGVCHNAADAAIVNAIADLGHRLGLDVVAEGVEDAETLAVITAAGCDRVQGFHFSCPLPPPMLRWAMNAS